MANEPSTRIDLVAASSTYLLALSFSKTTSPSYTLAVNLAYGARSYEERTIDNKLFHFVVFDRTQEDASRASMILKHLSGIKSLQVFIAGRPCDQLYRLQEVLLCYLRAGSCEDRTAHCHVAIGNPLKPRLESEVRALSIAISTEPQPEAKVPPVEIWAFPCSFLWNHFRFQPDHRSTFTAQVQAGGVREGCDWCPYFEPKQLTKIGTRITTNGESILIRDEA